MLFVPPSMSTTAAQDSEIPAWIKNNAGWWADGQIDDLSFLQGIQYLIKEGMMVIWCPSLILAFSPENLPNTSTVDVVAYMLDAPAFGSSY